MYKYVVAGALVSLTFGCSATTSTAGSPLLQSAASASNVASAGASVGTRVRCGLQGEPRVIATRVSPAEGVKATSEGYRVWLHYATKAKSDTNVAIAPESLQTVADDHVPPPAALLDRPADSVEVATEDGHRVVAWTQGSAFSHKGTPAESTEFGSSDPVDLGYQGRAIGDPAMAVTDEGSGVVAFIESNGTGYQLVAMRVSCSPN